MSAAGRAGTHTAAAATHPTTKNATANAIGSCDVIPKGNPFSARAATAAQTTPTTNPANEYPGC